MNIGVVNQKQFQVGTGENSKVHKFLELSIRPPFMQSDTFTITQNKNKQKENEPDWIVNYSFNRKGENYRRARVGAIWNKSKDGMEYKTGHIETPAMQNGRLNFSMFKAKPLDGEAPERVTWLYDVVWTYYDGNKDNNETQHNEYNQAPYYDTSTSQETRTNTPTIEIDEDEIPF